MTSEIKTPVRITACHSCGAQVPIYSRASVQMVCPFCRSTLVRNDMQWDNIGKMAMVADDLSPLHVGLQGRYDGAKFTVIGRVQQQYGEGVWNEWLLQLGNNQTRWLSEGSGLYYLSIANPSTEPLPSFSSLSLGQTVTLAGISYSVSNIEQARCIACEGEIPFAAEAGETANLVDLIGEHGNFACLDYSDKSVKLYTGKIIDSAQLNFGSLESKPLKQQASTELRCAGCGNAVTKFNPASVVFACASCKQVNNLSAAGKLIHGYSQAQRKIQPDIMPGSKGILEGHSYEVIGYMQRSSMGDSWDEYMLYNPSQGIRWLICASGHWTLMKPCAAPNFSMTYLNLPKRHKGRNYKHFSQYQAAVGNVLGEFYWQVKRDEKTTCIDYISPPYILCFENTTKEITWSEGYYIDRGEIANAFNIKPKRSSGVGINQPSPSVFSYLGIYAITIFLAFLISSLLHNDHAKSFFIGSMDLVRTASSTTLISDPFVLEDPHALFQVKTRTTLDNSWADFEYSLTNQDTGETRVMNREIAYYSGYDSDGGWSEGSRLGSATLANVVAGHYVLEVNGELDLNSPHNVEASFIAYHAKGGGKNFLALLVILAIGPILAFIGKYYFEKRRWSDSDHPWE